VDGLITCLFGMEQTRCEGRLGFWLLASGSMEVEFPVSGYEGLTPFNFIERIYGGVYQM
jgi:hypothetical protein